MKIAFCGSQGVGKTSVAKAIQASVPGSYVIPSTARLALAAGYQVNRDADPLSQLITMIARINAENSINSMGRLLISDRTPIDSLAYTMYQIDNMWGSVNDFYLEQCKMLSYNHVRTYDALFYFPVYDWEVKGDGVRDTDPLYQKAVDAYIQVLLDRVAVPLYTMPNLNVADRKSYIMHRLTDLHK